MVFSGVGCIGDVAGATFPRILSTGCQQSYLSTIINKNYETTIRDETNVYNNRKTYPL